jgi:16S rRNA (uracil1498-N3)-methyltransferase
MLELPAGEAHHLFKVLRGGRGARIEVVDTTGRLFAAELGEAGEAVLLEELAAPDVADTEVSLYQAVPKGGRMDLVVEKATEIGVTSIVPLLTQRGLVSPREGKVDRWRRVAEAAARQALRLGIPKVSDPVPFSEAVSWVAERGVLLHNDPDIPPVEAVAGSPAGLFVGPEGGWSEGELRLAGEAGMPLGSMGPYRLRSETAGIVAVARTLAALENRIKH